MDCYFANTGVTSAIRTIRTISSKCSSARGHIEQLRLTTSTKMLGRFKKAGWGWYHSVNQQDSLQGWEEIHTIWGGGAGHCMEGVKGTATGW